MDNSFSCYKHPEHKKIKNNFLQVGSAKIGKRPMRYSDVPKDLNGWVIDQKYKPIPFDMNLLKIKDKKKLVSGWWDGGKWEGRRFKEDYEVMGWKRYAVYEAKKMASEDGF